MKKTGTTNSTRLQLSRIVSNSFYSTTTFLTFTVEIHSNNLTHHQKYSKKQQMIYQLIKYLHDVEGLGYRKISQKLNQYVGSQGIVFYQSREADLLSSVVIKGR